MTVIRIKSLTWHAKYILIFSVKFIVPQLPHPSAFYKVLPLRGEEPCPEHSGHFGICRGGALSSTEAQARGATGAMPYHTDRSLNSIALTWLSEPFLQAVLIHVTDLVRFRYSSAQLPVIIHHLPQLSTGPDLTWPNGKPRHWGISLRS